MSFLDLMDEDLEEIECDVVPKMQPLLQPSSLPVSTASRPQGRLPGCNSKRSKNWTEF
jgi:hypothetical protein